MGSGWQWLIFRDKDLKRCAVCGGVFVPKSNRAKYCPDCAPTPLYEVKKPEIYIFDDSFSALDFKTDAKLRAALKDEVTNAAVILVAQRISTIMDADHILVLNEGKVAGYGTHKELLESCAIYREIALSQLSEKELAYA